MKLVFNLVQGKRAEVGKLMYEEDRYSVGRLVCRRVDRAMDEVTKAVCRLRLDRDYTWCGMAGPAVLCCRGRRKGHKLRVDEGDK